MTPTTLPFPSAPRWDPRTATYARHAPGTAWHVVVRYGGSYGCVLGPDDRPRYRMTAVGACGVEVDVRNEAPVTVRPLAICGHCRVALGTER